MEKLIGLIVVLLIVSCGSGTDKKTSNKDNKAIVAKWELTELEGRTIRENQPIFLEFDGDGKVSGFVGCNRLNASYAVEDNNKIDFDKLGTTRMTCPQIELENQFLEALNIANHFTVDKEHFTLSIDKESPLAKFHKMEESDIVNKYWKLKSLDGQPVMMAENQEREQYFMLRSDKTVSGFAGCNHLNGQYELENGDKIRFNDNMAVTLKACPDVDVDEQAFLDIFRDADHYTAKGDALTLMDDDGSTLAEFEAVYFQ